MITLLLSVCFAIIQITSAQSPCKTPDNWNGNCIALQQCRPLYNLITNKQNSLTTEERTFLRNSQCGGATDNVLVCCPRTFTIDDLPTTQYCGKEVGNKIVGGPETTIYEFPWMALLHYTRQDGVANNDAGFLCAGALIHENYVITTAYCVRSSYLTKEHMVLDFVRFGEHDLQSNPDCPQQNKCGDPVADVPVAEINVHENFIYKRSSDSREHDIALIRLERVVPYTDFILPICLPVGKLQNRNHDGYPLVVAGFGRTDDVAASKVKLKVGIKGVNSNECENIYRNSKVNLTITSKQLCAGDEDGNGACNGDGGGPLVAVEMGNESLNQDPFSYLVGLVSFGLGKCGIVGVPDIYTRVDKYIDWILDHMKK